MRRSHSCLCYHLQASEHGTEIEDPEASPRRRRRCSRHELRRTTLEASRPLRGDARRGAGLLRRTGVLDRYRRETVWRVVDEPGRARVRLQEEEDCFDPMIQAGH